MLSLKRNSIVLVHGLWNSPKIFERLIKNIKVKDPGVNIYAPFLKHSFGRIPIRNLANQLDNYIINKVDLRNKIDLLGFSMGGIVSRVWLQQFYGSEITNRLITVGSPHKGTFTAQFVPSCLFSGIADMKKGSRLIGELNDNCSSLNKVRCISYYCFSDLMSFPGWQCILPHGEFYRIPVLTHRELITSQTSIEILTRKILTLTKSTLFY